MALEAGALLRIRHEAEVHQAPSRSSPLLHIAQAGRLVKQLADAVEVAGAGCRVPLVPRGWIDAAAVELAGDCEGPRHPSAGATAAAATAAPAAGSASGAELLQLLGDSRKPRRRQAGEDSSWTQAASTAGQRSGESGHWESHTNGKSGGDWWDTAKSERTSAASGWLDLAAAEESLQGLCGCWRDTSGSTYVLRLGSDGAMEVCTTRPNGMTLRTRGVIGIQKQGGYGRVVWGRAGARTTFTVSWQGEESLEWHSDRSRPFRWERMAAGTAPQEPESAEPGAADSAAEDSAWQTPGGSEPREDGWEGGWNDRWGEARWEEDQRWTNSWPEEERGGASASAGTWRSDAAGDSEALKEPADSGAQQPPGPPSEDKRQAEQQPWPASSLPEWGAGAGCGWGANAEGDPGGTVLAALFSGAVASTDFLSGEACLDCYEAKVIFGSGDLPVSGQLLPFGSETGSTVCFALCGGTDGRPPRIVPGSLALADSAIARTAVLAGTLKSFSRRPSGERLGWLTSAATQAVYGCDVYVHGSMLDGLSIGDAVAFGVHENAKGQPQASTGTVTKLGAKAGGGEGQSSADSEPAASGMDALAYAPGRVVFGAAAGEDDLFESLLSQARQDAGIEAKPREDPSAFLYQ